MDPVKVKILNTENTIPVNVKATSTENTVPVRIAETIIQGGSYMAGDWVIIENGVISVDPQVTDEFIISDEKILGINHVGVSKIEGLEALVEDKISEIPIATDVLPGLVLSSDSRDSISVLLDGTMSINGLNINKIYQDADTEVVMYGGDSDM